MDLICGVKGRSEADFWREKECPVSADVVIARQRIDGNVRPGSTYNNRENCRGTRHLFQRNKRHPGGSARPESC
jgi:hypothetical protein